MGEMGRHRRPFVGTLTMELPTDADDEVASWIAAGTPPIYFGFGSMPVESAADTVAMISAACAQLGERALVCAGWSDFSDVPHFDHVKVVGAVNHAAIFPACRAVVHHGGAGTTAAGLRAGVPTLILWTLRDQPIWGAAVKRLKVGTARRFSATTREIAGRGPAHHPCPAIRHPGPRARHPDDQTRRKRCGRRRSCGKFRPPAACWLIGDGGPSGRSARHLADCVGGTGVAAGMEKTRQQRTVAGQRLDYPSAVANPRGCVMQPLPRCPQH